MGTVSLLAMPAANAASSGTNTSTVEVTPTEVRSVTVSPGTGTFATCRDPDDQVTIGTLTIPGGHCFLGSPTQEEFVTVTNGPVAGRILINGEAARPSDGGTPWALGASPAADVFTETSHNTVDGGDDQSLTTTPVCDVTYSPDVDGLCTASPNEPNDEFLRIDAPTSSTDSSSTFTVTTTWTAAP